MLMMTYLSCLRDCCAGVMLLAHIGTASLGTHGPTRYGLQQHGALARTQQDGISLPLGLKHFKFNV
jgi:hypothetical protein